MIQISRATDLHVSPLTSHRIQSCPPFFLFAKLHLCGLNRFTYPQTVTNRLSPRRKKSFTWVSERVSEIQRWNRLEVGAAAACQHPPVSLWFHYPLAGFSIRPRDFTQICHFNQLPLAFRPLSLHSFTAVSFPRRTTMLLIVKLEALGVKWRLDAGRRISNLEAASFCGDHHHRGPSLPPLLFIDISPLDWLLSNPQTLCACVSISSMAWRPFQIPSSQRYQPPSLPLPPPYSPRTRSG